MSCTESYKAVCKASGDRPARRRPSAVDAARLSRGEALADGVLPASGTDASAGCRRDRGPDRCGRAGSAVGLLEALRPAPRGRAPVQLHAGASRVRRPPAASAVGDDAARAPAGARPPLQAPPVLNRTWTVECMSEALSDRRPGRLLTVLDENTREGVAIAMGTALPSRRGVRVLSELVAVHGCPTEIRGGQPPRVHGPSPASTGARNTGWRCTAVSRVHQLSTRTSHASTGAIGPRG